jgi:hypothetical protein
VRLSGIMLYFSVHYTRLEIYTVVSFAGMAVFLWLYKFERLEAEKLWYRKE